MPLPDRAVGELGLEQQSRMVRALRHRLAARLGGVVAQIETHISFVLVAGDHAYKVKKALRTPFLDQSTLALRQRACQEELRLNRRLAPDLYLAVVPITGTPAQPELDGPAAAIDVAVQMRAFAPGGLWEELAAGGQLGAAQIDELAAVIDRFHAAAAVADPGGRLGTPDQVRAPLLQSLDELEGLGPAVAPAVLLQSMRRWEAAAFERLRPLLAQRLAQGRVRECHGDLHLGNVTVIEGCSTVFDGIDFNDDFRWIDVISEVAFMAMDLHAHGLPQLAHRFINAYLERGGDYAGVPVLNYYLVHRALVRAKVHGWRAAQCAAAPAGLAEGGTDGTAAGIAEVVRAAARRYLDLARDFSQRDRPAALLMLTHGYAGSGKSTATQGLLEAIGAIRIRADVERKRLASLQPLDRSGAQPASALYSPAMTAATYAQLARLAAPVLAGAYPAILDATFLRRAQRDAARQFAAQQGARCVMLDFDVDPALLRQRLRARTARGNDASDADEAVLDMQLQTAEPLQPDEVEAVFHCRPAERGVAGVDAGDSASEVDWTPLRPWLAPAADQDSGSGA